MSEILTREEFRFVLLSIPDVDEDHPHVADLLAHDAALRAEVERLRAMYDNACNNAGSLLALTKDTQQKVDDLIAEAIKSDEEIDRLSRVQLPLVCNGKCCPHCARAAEAEVERLKACLFQMQEAAKLEVARAEDVEADARVMANGIYDFGVPVTGEAFEAAVEQWRTK